MASAAAGHEENDKGIVVEERLQAYKRINAALIKLTTNMVKAQRAAMTAERQLAEGIKAVATEEANKKMQGVLQHLGDALSDTADKHDELIVSRFPRTVVTPLGSIKGAAITPTGLMIGDRQAAKKAYDKARDLFSELKVKPGVKQEKIVAAERAFVDARARKEHVDSRFVENVDRFEFQRLDEMKRVVEELVHGHMAYHCAALERLSRAAAQVASFNAADGADDLRNRVKAYS